MRYLCFVFAALLAGCANGGPAVVLKGERYRVEVADDPSERAMGLMFREQMADNRGMLFIFDEEAPRSFWMKNTRIPLDILYFNRRLGLVSWQADVPPCKADPCPSYPSTGPAKYVLELNAGEAARLGVKPGDVLQLEMTAP